MLASVWEATKSCATRCVPQISWVQHWVVRGWRGEVGRRADRCITYIELALLENELLVLEQQLNGLNELRIDGMQQGILCLHAHDNKQLDHLQILVVYGQR